ncbi:hypothetical protein P280DRAFT_482332 [Massarina eburnea CBS 473.64]|uniref:Uncharacterized protein n=1 Tax=Massarina eburnea CBS 473.64 TaxID=1395130 RepID=A0A6A6RTN5_9PLEO|nr:hypothetical protein P280DRAFT_482332 [Massarina eburnea CBS 473.64]
MLTRFATPTVSVAGVSCAGFRSGRIRDSNRSPSRSMVKASKRAKTHETAPEGWMRHHERSADRCALNGEHPLPTLTKFRGCPDRFTIPFTMQAFAEPRPV